MLNKKDENVMNILHEIRCFNFVLLQPLLGGEGNGRIGKDLRLLDGKYKDRFIALVIVVGFLFVGYKILCFVLFQNVRVRYSNRFVIVT